MQPVTIPMRHDMMIPRMRPVGARADRTRHARQLARDRRAARRAKGR